MNQKIALCVGINAYGHGSDLSGCVNDANDWADVLRGRGYTADVLLDVAATKEAMIEAIKERLAVTKKGDQFIFQYSGHGSYIPDTDGDEQDGRDEALCPVDIWDGNYLIDDELYDLFNARAVGSKVLFISDSCHSGTVNRFMPFQATSTAQVSKVRFLPPQQFLAKKDFPRVSPLVPPRKMKSSALLLAGCRDFEFSYDTWFNDRANGAFSRVAIDALSPQTDQVTAKDLYAGIRRNLPSQQYPQSPQIVGTSAQRKWKMF